ncbi:hypothetical protein Sjap_009155 [Stephania japonica]|uniref:Uncharacterized protein n=1 Tax=Stephania japonica TaxID=461633 RepID=A0AAP0JQV8_9MAGN
MFSDMISSLCRRTRYLPCKLFSINSVTLFLLATASKLPVDLTTYMPSARDQLSKLSSTAMVCVSIGFLVPSFGINQENESITNLIALGLMVITIVVNVCIQIYTGVIFSFVAGHIVILCCMVLLLLLIWHGISDTKWQKPIMVDANKKLFKKGEARSFVHQVKLWYMGSCITNPQYSVCSLTCPMVAMICMVCLAVVSHAGFRSIVLHKLEFCKDVSDYGWSISIILVTQIVTLVVGSLGTIFRCTIIYTYPPSREKHSYTITEIERFALKFLSNKRELLKVVSLTMLSRLLVKLAMGVIHFVALVFLGVPVLIGIAISFVLPLILISHFCYPTCFMSTSSSYVSKITSPWKQELIDHVGNVMYEPSERMMWICVEDMNKLIGASITSSTNHLVQFLTGPCSSHPPPQALEGHVQQIGIRAFPDGYRISCLSFVTLVRIVSISIPPTLAKPLIKAFDEAFKMIYYIDKKINVGSYEDGRKRRFAKVLLPYKGVHLSKKGTIHSGWSVSEAISSIKEEGMLLPKGLAARDMNIIIDFILMRETEYTSIEELYFHLEQQFVDMLRFFLSQLPIAI